MEALKEMFDQYIIENFCINPLFYESEKQIILNDFYEELENNLLSFLPYCLLFLRFSFLFSSLVIFCCFLFPFLPLLFFSCCFFNARIDQQNA